MPLVRGQYAELVAPVANNFTFQAYNEVPEMYRRINKILNTDQAFVDDWMMTGFGPLAPKGELERTILDEPIKLGGIRIHMLSYALGFVISEEMMQDARINVVPDLSQALGRSARVTAELYGHDVWNDAFAGAKYLGRDGKPLIAADHPIARTGGVLANKPAVDTDISNAAFEAAYGNFLTQVDDLGYPIQLAPAFLVVHPTQYVAALQILQSPGIPSANHAGISNVLQDWVVPIADPWLTDQDAWFLIAPPAQLDVRFYWRQTPDTKTWDDNDADGVIHKIKERFGVGFGDWRGVYGSPGA